MADWYYYNHALLPTCAPHETPDLTALDNLSPFIEAGQNPLFARWTSDYDQTQSQEWYYVIKDTPFDLSALKAKRRYEITKGMRNFTCLKIDAKEHSDELLFVMLEAYKTYPKKYRPNLNIAQMKQSIAQWENVYGAFDAQKNLCAFVRLTYHEKYVGLTNLKAIPSS